MDFDAKRVLIVGIARSGIAAARVLNKRGAIVSICDRKPEDQLGQQLNELHAMKIKIFAGTYPQVNPESYDLVVASPGVPQDISPFRQARETGVPVIGELELAYAIKPEGVDLYAVTGTNGKTTTVSLLQTIMAVAGRNSRVAGNIGIPLSAVVDEMEEGVISVEVSSFQLETVRDFRPHICGLLNITPDHLDRHKNMELYTRTKSRIFSNQNQDDFAVLNYEDPAIRELSAICPAKVVFFSTEQILQPGISVRDGVISVADESGIRPICPLDRLQLRGKHNLENILCAVGMAAVAGVQPEIIAGALSSFQGVRHRMEEVATKNGVMYVNDSKATNPDSAIKALQSFDDGLILIAGGRNKGSSFAVLAKHIKDRVKALILLGEAREELKEAVEKAGFSQPITIVNDLNEAVQAASKAAAAGDVVLLSPACASWDMFDNYEQRGDLFCELVKQLNS